MTIDFKEVEAMLADYVAPAEQGSQALKRRRILDAATELFVQQGYRKTSVDEVAQAAGVAKGTVYLYFSNKAELLSYAIAEEKKHYLAELKPVFDPSAPASERLKRWIRAAVTLSRKMPLASKLIRGDREFQLVMQELDSDLRAERERFECAFVGQLIEAAAPGVWSERELEEKAAVLINVLYAALTDQGIVSIDMSAGRYGDLLASTLVSGVLDVGGT